MVRFVSIAVRAVVLTTKPTLSSSSTTVVTTRTTHSKVSSTSTIEPVTSTLPHSTTHRYWPNTSPNKERNEHTSKSYTTNSHLMESDNTATVVLVITVTFTCICLAVVITLILCRRYVYAHTLKKLVGHIAFGLSGVRSSRFLCIL